MTLYLLDTPPLTAYLFGRQSAVALIAPWVQRGEVGTSIVVYGEIIEHRKGRPGFLQHQRAVRRSLQEIRPFTLTYGVLERYADIRRTLRPAGSLIGDMDTLIAATAVEGNLTLVTSDRDFQRVPDLFLMLLDRAQLR